MSRFWTHVDKSAGPRGCWLWTGSLNNRGYGQFRTSERLHLAHRYVLGLLEPSDGRTDVVMHSCDTPACVNPAHLRRATQRDNNLDCLTKGRRQCRSAQGTDHPKHKLDDEKVLTIRAQLAGGARQRDLAAEYGVARSLIYRVGARKVWTHV